MRTPRRLAAALAAALALGVAACGGDDGVDRQVLIDSLVSEGATTEEAECFVTELGDDAERLWAAEEGDLSEDDTTRLFEAFTACAPGAGG